MDDLHSFVASSKIEILVNLKLQKIYFNKKYTPKVLFLIEKKKDQKDLDDFCQHTKTLIIREDLLNEQVAKVVVSNPHDFTEHDGNLLLKILLRNRPLVAIDELGGPQAQFTYQTEIFPITNTVVWYLN